MPAPGETVLSSLLSTLEPHLDPLTWIFLSIPPSSESTVSQETRSTILAQAKMTFSEAEGLTAVIPLSTASELGFCNSMGVARDVAQAAVQAAMPSRLITLKVQSSLEAVGMMAVIARGFADAGIPCNVVAGFLHDHLFVPLGMEEAALEVLAEIQKTASAGSAGR